MVMSPNNNKNIISGIQILSITEKELLNKNAVLLKNVEEGFANREYFILKGDRKGFKAFMHKALNRNGEAEVYADFYYPNLSIEQRNGFLKALSKENLDIFKKYNWPDKIYIGLNSELLDFLLDITMDELLFCSFYFTRFPCTVWGNYNLTFPVFFKDSETKGRYEKLAAECELLCN
ncbi:hypothetical protein Ana3638_00520 [Anaerocolumna sedimenticola]|uniref:Uncharacterized protein n=1 Tax=Anaerocolumna sedimenticola TaxID=2696063 RepID=A0A6P1THQ5_9FIRM|nr:hypothetical protein [Anaerocolumna sedimenticola]QHQ59466.1 hypothetical protein Ana3638_00520 [Anaerocolumna sedimenticola]